MDYYTYQEPTGSKGNRALIPVKNYGQVLEQKAKDQDLAEWKLFAARITRNPFVRDYLQQRQEHCCPWCGGSTRSGYHLAVHHLDYEHVCGFPKTITPMGKRRALKSVPDCQSCSIQASNLFSECMRRICLVHHGCHQEIHKIAQVTRSRC
jgi:hypothetical protein